MFLADNVYLKGAISASSGTIGGYSIGTNKLTTTGFEIGDSTQTYAISSSNFNINHSGVITASNALFDGNVTAVSFSEKYVVVNSGNVANYTASNGAGVNLLFDGSGGGEITMNMQLDVDPGKIMNILVPNSGSGLASEVQLTINTTGCSYDDGDIASNYESNQSRL